MTPIPTLRKPKENRIPVSYIGGPQCGYTGDYVDGGKPPATLRSPILLGNAPAALVYRFVDITDGVARYRFPKYPEGLVLDE